MEFKGTKSGWKLSKDNQFTIFSEGGKNISTVMFSPIQDNERKANALLISKAPEMLAMLNELISIATNYHTESEIQDRISEAKQLIKEATEI